METVSLNVNTRESGSAATVIKEGMIPCVFYGAGKENLIFSVDYQEFRRTYAKAGGNTVIELNIDGKDKVNVLVHEVQLDPVTDLFTHIDFKFVDLNKEVTADIPLVAVGTALAVKDLAGTLMQNKDMLSVKCLAKNIPHTIEFDISPLVDFHSNIHIKDLKLPEGVEALDDENLTIATVIAPRAEEEETPAEEVEGAEGEEKKEEGKKEEENKEEGGD